MKNLFRLAAVAVCAFALSSVSNAQMRGGGFGPPQFAGVFNPTVGSGAAYEMKTQDGVKTIEMAIVGKDTVDGKDAYWWEMVMPDHRGDGGEMIFKSLLVMDGANTHSSKTIMQLPGKLPMEMPSGMSRGAGSHVPADARTGAEDLGSESITVPAGTFTTEHYRAKDGSGDTWVAKNAGPYGLVKHQGKDTTMVLTKVYTDYKDKITGTPVPFNPAMFGGGQDR